MEYKLEITKVKEAPFTGKDGSQVSYAWVKGIRKEDGVSFEFGTKNKFKVGDSVIVNLEKTESPKGYRYKEIIED